MHTAPCNSERRNKIVARDRVALKQGKNHPSYNIGKKGYDLGSFKNKALGNISMLLVDLSLRKFQIEQ